ncbi:hypothetical protein [Sediminicola sp. 1XM1-17]|uniref:hypothetical protein n=1 Tax=Sediminicola sp. 1XM1-17 TaxID=3127702 RepID=UPI00307892B7
MKNISLLVLVLFFSACDRDSIEDRAVAASSNIKIIGKGYDANGNFLRNVYQYDNHRNKYNPNGSIDLFSELGISERLYAGYFADKKGITLREYVRNNENIFHYKDFNTSKLFKISMPYINTSQWTYWHHNEVIYFFYKEDDTYNATDGTVEYKMKLLNLKTNEESTIGFGKFDDGFYGVKTALVGNKVYLHWNRYSYDANTEEFFMAFDLDNLKIMDRRSDFKKDTYNLVGDDKGNCYLFGREFNYKYDYNSQSMEELSIQGETTYLYNSYTGFTNSQVIIDDKYYASTIGPQPGTGAIYPIIYDLKTGEVQWIDIFNEITQFEEDEHPWRPIVQSYSLDYRNKVYLLGASNNLAVPHKSHGVFTVDFEGNVLSKQKIPIAPFQIIN